ncbi:MAG: hypothetical protein AAF039_03575 [Bacteroidota bacterium]
MKLRTITTAILATMFIIGCSNEDSDEDNPVVLDAGTLSGGPFSFTVDGVPDMVSDISLSDFNGVGDVQSYVITDDARNILGLPPNLEAVGGVDFDAAGVGDCYIYHITHQSGLTGLAMGENLDDLDGDFDLSNFIMVNRAALNAGELLGGPYNFTVDGQPDMVSGITLDDTNLNGDVQSYVITDDSRNILGLPPTLEAVEGVNFDDAGVGSCYIYHITYSGELVGLEADKNLDDLVGNFNLSNFIVVNRNALNAGVLSGGPYEFIVDGTPDMATGLTLDDSEVTGSNQGFVITDDSLNILGLPPTIEAARGVNFDDAGVGVCLIWHITYEDGLVGLEAGKNAGELEGTYALSNSITVTRNGLNAGVLSGGPYEFTVDGTPDMAAGLTLDASGVTGSKQGFVITDDNLNILGLPPTLEAARGVDFDEAGPGVCYIYHITYEDGIMGLEAGKNAADLEGFFALSNFITVTRNALNAGTLSGGPYKFTVDGTPDMALGLALDASEVTGSKQGFVITDEHGNILGLPPTLEAARGVDFDAAGVGICFIWHLSYEEGLVGLEAGRNTADFEGYYALSNAITVIRNPLNAGTLSGGPYMFTVDGTPDMAKGLTLDASKVTGSNQGFVITDDKLNILGLPPTLEAARGVDFDEAGPGVCLIWHITYEDGIMGLEAGKNAADLEGFFALSNSIRVYRNPLNAGTLSGGPYEFVVDGYPDMVSGIYLDDSNLNGSNQGWVITDDNGKILGLPPTLEDVENVDFDAAGVGVCYIYHITYEDGLQGLAGHKNISDLSGFFDLSNFIMVTRNPKY